MCQVALRSVQAKVAATSWSKICYSVMVARCRAMEGYQSQQFDS